MITFTALLAAARQAYRYGRQTGSMDPLSAEYVALRAAWQHFADQFEDVETSVRDNQPPRVTVQHAYENGFEVGRAICWLGRDIVLPGA